MYNFAFVLYFNKTSIVTKKKLLWCSYQSGSLRWIIQRRATEHNDMHPVHIDFQMAKNFISLKLHDYNRIY